MSFMRIFHIFDSFLTPHKASSSEQILNSQTKTETLEQAPTKTWPQIERRSGVDRRVEERRIINCQPYIDTRKNNGRRRSFGRRARDQATALPF